MCVCHSRVNITHMLDARELVPEVRAVGQTSFRHWDNKQQQQQAPLGAVNCYSSGVVGKDGRGGDSVCACVCVWQPRLNHTPV
jgi:hypothetical protein